MTIKIEIIIEEKMSNSLFEREAPWYGKLLAEMDIINKNEKIAETISKKIRTNLIDKGIKANVNYNIF